MSVQFKTVNVSIPAQTGLPVPKQGKTDAFESTVRHANACIQSWDVQYVNKDRAFYRALVKIDNVQINTDNSVQFDVSAGVRDHSGVWDDEYQGEVEVLVIAELADN